MRCGGAGTLVGVHIRRRDFGYGRFWIAPERWYAQWLGALLPRLDAPVLYVASDDPQARESFSRRDSLDFGRIGAVHYSGAGPAAEAAARVLRESGFTVRALEPGNYMATPQ
jgi:hypothetical protein